MVDDDDPCSEPALRAEIRANARAERGVAAIALVAAAITGIVLVLRDLVT